MKVIFLDIDGVLVYSGYTNNETANIDENKVLLLKKIVDASKAVIVLSSSWRTYTQKHRNYILLVNILQKYGLNIYDKTDYIRAKLSSNNKPSHLMTEEDTINIDYVFGTGRGAEIDKWIKENQPESFVILDDENHNWKDYGFHENWVQSSYIDDNGGLNNHHVEKAIKILSQEE